jgi:hypothetical protein
VRAANTTLDLPRWFSHFCVTQRGWPRHIHTQLSDCSLRSPWRADSHVDKGIVFAFTVTVSHWSSWDSASRTGSGELRGKGADNGITPRDGSETHPIG